MKIGILTFHCAHNYGAVLQAYGLQEYLKSCGHEVEVIDYRPKYLTQRYLPFPLPNLCGASFANKFLRLMKWVITLPKRAWDFPIRKRRCRGFEAFILGKLNISQTVFKEAREIPAEKYDAIFFGSDQIWNPSHTHGIDPVFWGNFPGAKATLKIAYAASAGAASEMLAGNELIVNALKNFDAISVREDNLAVSLQPKTALKIETVLDPTLLVDKSVWEKLAEPPKTKRRYVLVYQVSYNPEARRIAQELAVQIGAEVVEIGLEVMIRQWDKTQKSTESPGQFVGWVKDAACVVTTSFHGTAFSLIFEKSFYYIGNGNAAENRPKQILGALGLMGRYVEGKASTPVFSEIDYARIRVGGTLSTLKSQSRKFVASSLRI